MKYWIDYIWSTEQITYEALNILHMKHWESSKINSTNLIFILHFLKFWWDAQQIQKKTTQVLHTTIWSAKYITYKALNILHMKHWEKQWTWFCKSDSYFALFEILMRRSTNLKKNEQGFSMCRKLCISWHSFSLCLTMICL